MSDGVEDTPTMADRLNATGSKLAELSKKAASATKSAVIKTTEVIQMLFSALLKILIMKIL